MPTIGRVIQGTSGRACDIYFRFDIFVDKAHGIHYSFDSLSITFLVNEMNEDVQVKDRFWMYVGCAVFIIVSGILMVKQSENAKYEPIKQLADDEKAAMNIRVLG